jgi:uncharacterized protein with gpF-like domain
MLHVHVANLARMDALIPGHRAAGIRKRVRPLSPVRPSHADELAYQADLRGLVQQVQRFSHSHVIPTLRATFPGQLVSDAAVPSRLQQILGDAARSFGGVHKQAAAMAKIAGQRTLASTDARLAKAIRDSLGVDIAPYLTRDGRIGKVIGQKLLDNVNLIETIPATYFQGIADRVAENWQTGGRWENLVEALARNDDVAMTRAKVIARDQTSKMNAAFNQVRQTDVGIEEYEWQTSNDERVRGDPAGKYPDAESDHFSLNGTRHRWGKPGPCAGTIDGAPCHPGEDVECRCNAVPYINLDAIEAQMGLAPMEEAA